MPRGFRVHDERPLPEPHSVRPGEVQRHGRCELHAVRAWVLQRLLGPRVLQSVSAGLRERGDGCNLKFVLRALRGGHLLYNGCCLLRVHYGQLPPGLLLCWRRYLRAVSCWLVQLDLGAVFVRGNVQRRRVQSTGRERVLIHGHHVPARNKPCCSEQVRGVRRRYVFAFREKLLLRVWRRLIQYLLGGELIDDV
jgi:hypothetical protein